MPDPQNGHAVILKDLTKRFGSFTAVNKLRVDAIFEKSLEAKNIAYTRFTASPTILNNILWQGMAEGDTAFYHGYYSFFDAEPRIDSFTVIPKNHHLLAGMEGSYAATVSFSHNDASTTTPFSFNVAGTATTVTGSGSGDGSGGGGGCAAGSSSSLVGLLFLFLLGVAAVTRRRNARA